MLATDAFPLTPYPRSWYLAAHSDELAVGEVKPLRYFGRDLVLFRTADGEAHVTDAHCPHLGAHIGHGGEVRGACVRCPFHGWEFEAASGSCVRIANGDPVPPKARLRRWQVDEVNGMVLVWFHEGGEAPTWRMPAYSDYEPAGWSRWLNTSWVLKARIQDVTENDSDVSHSPVVHGITDKPPAIAMDAEGPRCTWSIDLNIELHALGLPKLPRVGPLRRLPSALPTKVEVLRWGLSVGLIRQASTLPLGLEFSTQTLAATTPIDDDHIQLVFRHRVRRSPIPGLTEVMLRQYSRLFDTTATEDVKIWENKIYRMRPAASKSDWAILRYRRWARQFYDEAHWDAAMGREGGLAEAASAE